MSIYMQIGDIKGNVTAEGLQDFIELKSFDFSVQRKMNTEPGAIYDREGTKPSISEVIITKYADKTTPLLFGKATSGVAESKPIVIKFVNTGAKLSEYMTVTLYDVMVSGYHLTDDLLQAGSEGVSAKKHNKPLETISLNFDKIEVKYTPYDEKHKAGSPVTAGFDLKTAKAT